MGAYINVIEKMTATTWLVLCVVCVLLVPGQCSTSCTLDQKDPCQCTYQDGGSTWRINIRDYFSSYPIKPNTTTKYVYSYSCYNNPCTENKKVSAVACQYDKDQGADTPLGRANNNTVWEIIDLTAENFQFSITYKGGQDSRVTHVTFTHTSDSMAMKVNDNKTEGKNYVMEASGSKVKSVGSSTGGGGGGGGTGDIAGPIGIVIILLVVIGFVTYCIVGGVYLYRVKGARGREVIPQYTFWREVPLLIRDGFFFTISPCYKRSSYESL